MASPAVDPRWRLLEAEIATAVADLAAAVEMDRIELRQPEVPARLRRQQEKAFQKFLQDGYASIEKALIRVLELFDEPVPTGRTWHADLSAMASRPLDITEAAGRPRFAPAFFADIETLRRFRHVAIHGYERFDQAMAAPAVAAAARLAKGLPAAAEEFALAAGLRR